MNINIGFIIAIMAIMILAILIEIYQSKILKKLNSYQKLIGKVILMMKNIEKRKN